MPASETPTRHMRSSTPRRGAAPVAGGELREEAAAALAARRELGEELERAIIESFVERVEQTIDARVDQRLAERHRAREVDRTTVAIGLGSIALSIPITGAASALPDGSSGMAVGVMWVAIVIINVLHALSRR
jgi:hypothetical protein